MTIYNPILLLLWKANLDILFISENSLTLAHYVTGYIKKAEKSHIHELWHDISTKKTLYNKLWSFCVQSLQNRECGYMRLLIPCWVIIFVRSHKSCNGLQLSNRTKEKDALETITH